MAEVETFDLVVVGAGITGLTNAKTYLQVHPDAKMVLYDGGSSLGGTWEKARLYPELRTNNVFGRFEHSDFPISNVAEVKPGDHHIPGHVVNEYMHAYANHFGITPRIRCCSKVETAEQKSDGWLLTVRTISQGQDSSQLQVHAKRLIVATGLTSEPYLPSIPGSDSFEAPLIHSKDFAQHADLLQDTKRVAVFGGAKSAYDVAYALASKGIAVDWIIRKSGHGPVWMAPARVTPFKKILESLVFVRALTWFSPCVWGEADGYGFIRRLLHGTAVGRWLADRFWDILGSDVVQLNGWDEHPEVHKLKPWTKAFEIGNGLGILNYPTNVFDYVRDGTIKIHVEDITGLSPSTIHLSSGEILAVGALVLCSGWKHEPTMKFLPEGIEEELGIPHKGAIPEKAIAQADQELFSRLPKLMPQNASPTPALESDQKRPGNEAFMLYRFLVPPPSPAFRRNIAFVGKVTTLNTHSTAEITALWVTAFFDGKVATDISEPAQHRMDETTLHNRFAKWRYPAGHGHTYPDMVFDTLPFYDMLLHDLGLQNHRKKSAFKELFDPYGPQDYKGIVDEWVANQNARDGDEVNEKPKLA